MSIIKLERYNNIIMYKFLQTAFQFFTVLYYSCSHKVFIIITAYNQQAVILFLCDHVHTMLISCVSLYYYWSTFL